MTNLRPECIILKALLLYNNYNKYLYYIKNINKEYKELNKLYHSLQELQENFPGTDKSISELALQVWSSYPQLREIERESISKLLSDIDAIEVSEQVLQESLSQLKVRSDAARLAFDFMDVSEGRKEWGEVISSIDTSQETNSADYRDKSFVTDRLDELEKDTINSPGLHWRLDCLNRSLGPLRVGDFGFVFARPESGKTTFLASEITFMASQVDRPIIWFNNEEQGSKVRLRTIQAALGVTNDALWKDKQATQKQYDDLTKGMIRIYDDASIYKREVEAVVQALEPSLIVFDQIDKIKGFDADRNDLVYGKIYQWARELAKKFAPVIGVCQSDGQGEGVKWLTMSHVADAKTSKQAEADWILGIGRSNEVSTESIRFFNISKNKLLGDQRTDPEERHGRFPVYIRPTIARYEDLEE